MRRAYVWTARMLLSPPANMPSTGTGLCTAQHTFMHMHMRMRMRQPRVMKQAAAPLCSHCMDGCTARMPLHAHHVPLALTCGCTCAVCRADQRPHGDGRFCSHAGHRGVQGHGALLSSRHALACYICYRLDAPAATAAFLPLALRRCAVLHDERSVIVALLRTAVRARGGVAHAAQHVLPDMTQTN